MILRGQNNENITREKSRKFGSQFEALGVLGSKSWRKQTLIFFQKKLGSVFYNFLIRALLRPQIAIQSCATISRVNFSRFGHLQIKISDKIFLGHNPLGIFNRSGFGNVKKLINEWKIGTWKIIVCKKPKYFIITSSGFAQFWNSISYTLAWFLYLCQSNQSSKFSILSRIIYSLNNFKA